MNRIDHREILTTLSNPHWEAEMNFDLMDSQAKLMNGNDQFLKEEDERAKETLKMQIEYERLHGNRLLLKIYSDALKELEARKYD